MQMDKFDWNALKLFIEETQLTYDEVRAELAKFVSKKHTTQKENKDFKDRQMTFPGLETANEL